VSVEHCIGNLKARFASLHGLLAHRISGKKDVAACLKWVGSCVILHNFLLLDLDDGIQPHWEQADDSMDLNPIEDRSDEDDRDDLNGERLEDSMALAGKRRRDLLLLQQIIDEYDEEL